MTAGSGSATATPGKIVIANLEYMPSTLRTLEKAKTPPPFQADRREISYFTPPAKTVTVKPNTSKVKVRELKLHLKTPSGDEYAASIEQCGGTFHLLSIIFPPGKEFVQKAAREQQLIGAPAHA